MADARLAVVRPSPLTPRRDHKLEACTLASAMIDDAALATIDAMLDPTDYDDAGHRAIFVAMRSLAVRSVPVDTITLAGELACTGQLAGLGGESRLGVIAAHSASGRECETHCRMLRDLAAMRRLLSAGHAIVSAASDASLSADAAVDASMSALFSATELASDGPEHIGAAIGAAADECVGAIEDLVAGARGVSTGYVQLDRLISGRGVKGSRVYVIGGLPGTGKTSLVLNIMMRSASRGTSVLMFSLEMKKREVGGRMLCIEARIASDRYEANMLTADDVEAIGPAAQTLSTLPIYVDATKEQTITQMRARAKRHKARHGLGMLVVDYIQLVGVPGADDEYSRITGAIAGLTKLADELDVPILCVASMNRGGKARQGKDQRPQMSDLMGSGRIESDAALVAFLYRDELVNRDSDDAGVAEFIIRKQRHGQTNVTARLKFDAPCMRFENLADDEPPPPDTNYQEPRDE